MSDEPQDAEIPARRDADQPAHPAPPAPTRMSRGAVAALVFAALAGVAVLVLFITLMVSGMGHSAEDQFKQIQYCLDHPKAQVCKPETFPP